MTEKTSFGSILDSWLIRKRISIKPSTYASYHNIIHRHIKPVFGNYSPQEINCAILEDFIARKYISGSGLSEKTLRDILTVTKCVLRSADVVVDRKLNLPRVRKKRLRIFSKHEQTLLERYLVSGFDRCKLGILLCLYTGLRIGEVCALRWDDISLSGMCITVSRSMQRIQTLDNEAAARTKVIIASPKSDSAIRTIPLPKCLFNKLIIFNPDNPDAFFLTGDTVRYIEPRTYQNRFKTYLKYSSVADANFHTTRHTFATRCVELGFDIKSLSEILGHSNVNITLNRYVHPSFDLKKDNMNKLTLLH